MRHFLDKKERKLDGKIADIHQQMVGCVSQDFAGRP
jgi:hypothetical protein